MAYERRHDYSTRNRGDVSPIIRFCSDKRIHIQSHEQTGAVFVLSGDSRKPAHIDNRAFFGHSKLHIFGAKSTVTPVAGSVP